MYESTEVETYVPEATQLEVFEWGFSLGYDFQGQTLPPGICSGL